MALNIQNDNVILNSFIYRVIERELEYELENGSYADIGNIDKLLQNMTLSPFDILDFINIARCIVQTKDVISDMNPNDVGALLSSIAVKYLKVHETKNVSLRMATNETLNQYSNTLIVLNALLEKILNGEYNIPNEMKNSGVTHGILITMVFCVLSYTLPYVHYCIGINDEEQVMTAYENAKDWLSYFEEKNIDTSLCHVRDLCSAANDTIRQIELHRNKENTTDLISDFIKLCKKYETLNMEGLTCNTTSEAIKCELLELCKKGLDASQGVTDKDLYANKVICYFIETALKADTYTNYDDLKVMFCILMEHGGCQPHCYSAAVDTLLDAINEGSVSEYVRKYPNLDIISVDDYILANCFATRGFLLDVLSEYNETIAKHISARERWSHYKYIDKNITAIKKEYTRQMRSVCIKTLGEYSKFIDTCINNS